VEHEIEGVRRFETRPVTSEWFENRVLLTEWHVILILTQPQRRIRLTQMKHVIREVESHDSLTHEMLDQLQRLTNRRLPDMMLDDLAIILRVLYQYRRAVKATGFCVEEYHW
jgi:hypothetical protein